MILIIDNYDSFTYNLVQRIGELDPGIDLRVYRNDKITAAEAEELAPDHVIISPGPCTPREGGISNEIIGTFAGRVPLMGVCLGHQCIGYSFGMTVSRHDRLMHGKTSEIHHDEHTIFDGLSNPFTATRYHSLIIQRDTIDTTQWEISAWTDRDEVMGVRKIDSPQPVEGVQFHPESFLTEEGPLLLANFLGLPRPEIDAATS